jgi:hypothetical protein
MVLLIMEAQRPVEYIPIFHPWITLLNTVVWFDAIPIASVLQPIPLIILNPCTVTPMAEMFTVVETPRWVIVVLSGFSPIRRILDFDMVMLSLYDPEET